MKLSYKDDQVSVGIFEQFCQEIIKNPKITRVDLIASDSPERIKYFSLGDAIGLESGKFSKSGKLQISSVMLEKFYKAIKESNVHELCLQHVNLAFIDLFLSEGDKINRITIDTVTPKDLHLVRSITQKKKIVFIEKFQVDFQNEQTILSFLNLYFNTKLAVVLKFELIFQNQEKIVTSGYFGKKVMEVIAENLQKFGITELCFSRIKPEDLNAVIKLAEHGIKVKIDNFDLGINTLKDFYGVMDIMDKVKGLSDHLHFDQIKLMFSENFSKELSVDLYNYMLSYLSEIEGVTKFALDVSFAVHWAYLLTHGENLKNRISVPDSEKLVFLQDTLDLSEGEENEKNVLKAALLSSFFITLVNDKNYLEATESLLSTALTSDEEIGQLINQHVVTLVNSYGYELFKSKTVTELLLKIAEVKLGILKEFLLGVDWLAMIQANKNVALTLEGILTKVTSDEIMSAFAKKYHSGFLDFAKLTNLDPVVVLKKYQDGLLDEGVVRWFFYVRNKLPIDTSFTDSAELETVPKIFTRFSSCEINQSDLLANGITELDPVITEVFKNFYILNTSPRIIEERVTDFAITLQRMIGYDGAEVLRFLLNMQKHLGIVFFDKEGNFSSNPIQGLYDYTISIENHKWIEIGDLANLMQKITELSFARIFNNSGQPFFANSNTASEKLAKIIQDMPKNKHIAHNSLIVQKPDEFNINFGGQIIASVIADFTIAVYMCIQEDEDLVPLEKFQQQLETSLVFCPELVDWINQYVTPILEEIASDSDSDIDTIAQKYMKLYGADTGDEVVVSEDSGLIAEGWLEEFEQSCT